MSIWFNNSNLPRFKSLDKNLKTDILIVGGGITGILCAYFLHQQGIDYTLVEGNTICSGVTKNTTAKITYQHGLIYNKLLNTIGIEKTQLYLDAHKKALNIYQGIGKKISCDFERKNSYVYSIDNIEILEKELKALNKIKFNANLVKTIDLPFDIVGAIEFKNQAQFNPMKLVSSISKDLNIYENTFIKEISGNVAKTDKFTIKADKIIICSHFPFINTHGLYFLKMYQQRSYVLALKNAQNVHGMYIDEAQGGLSFRNYQDLLLLGGGSHRTGKNSCNWDYLTDFAKKYYPNSIEVERWATQDCISLDNVSYIGQYSKNTPNMYVATGFNKWGMTSSMVSAMVLSDLILKGDSIYKDVFSPSRSILKHQILVNGFEATKNLLKISKPRCSHMKCALHWNSAEQSWDCCCHGSRFSKDGILINNPATKDIKNI